ncbi:MAG: (Fe-S)-binding protein [Alphaproteobacteria bacterium]
MESTYNRPEEAVHAKLPQLDLPELYQCVHCGLCLNQCPTYRALRLETESPRGRIHLVKAAAEGRIEPNERFKEHLYLCLLCRACETACPSGVRYSRIAETARAQLGPTGSTFSRSIQNFAFTQLLPYPGRLRLAVNLLRVCQRTGLRSLVRSLLPKSVCEIESLLPAIPRRFFEPVAKTFPAIGKQRAKVALLNGCVMPLLFGNVNEATVRVLQRNGCEVVLPEGQTCCGALNVHNGETMAARNMARRNVDAFLAAEVDAVIVNAAGCGAAMKEYGHLLGDDPGYADKARRFTTLVKDAAEFLAAIGIAGKLGALNLTVTYQDPCHLAHGQRVRSQPRALLQAIPGLRLIEMQGSDRCCGSAGIYNATHPAMSRALLTEKMQGIAATKAQAVVAPNPGCMLQLRYGARRYGPDLAVHHLLDLLDEAYAKAEASPAL